MKRAPYYADIERLRQGAPQISWRLFASGTDAERWDRAQRWIIRGHHAATLLPAGCAPAALRWPSGTCVADVTGQPGALVEGLAQALLRDGCTHALLVDVRNPARSFHCKPQPQECAA